jgi:hypothetical protein
MKEFTERAEKKALTTNLQQAFRFFMPQMYIADRQIIQKLVCAMPKPSIDDMGALPAIRCSVINDYLSRCNSKRDCVMAMLRMSVILWWRYQDGQISKETIEKLTEVLKGLSEMYPVIKTTKVGVGYTFLDFHKFLNEKDDDNAEADTTSDGNTE